MLLGAPLDRGKRGRSSGLDRCSEKCGLWSRAIPHVVCRRFLMSYAQKLRVILYLLNVLKSSLVFRSDFSVSFFYSTIFIGFLQKNWFG